MDKSNEIIKLLKMTPHPEGGYFVESYRDENISIIYYLLKKNQKSHWHRLTKNEILHFYSGDPLMVYLSKDGINIKKITLNNDQNILSHFVVKKKSWFSMKTKGEYSLIGCTVSPPFNYSDLEIAPKKWVPKKN